MGFKTQINTFLAGIYLLQVNYRNTRTRCEIYSKLTIKTPERRHLRCSDVFVVNFKHTSHLVLVFLLLTCNCRLEHVIAGWLFLNMSIRFF